MTLTTSEIETLQKELKELEQSYKIIKGYKKEILSVTEVDLFFLNVCVSNTEDFARLHGYFSKAPRIKKNNVKSCIKVIEFIDEVLGMFQSTIVRVKARGVTTPKEQ